jgi:rhodanese-related sulfurtransferase
MIEVKSKTISPVALIASFGTGELLDVRTPPEYASAHVPGVKLMPLSDLKVEAYLAQHAPGKPIYVFCHGGERAIKAIEQFERAGCHDCVLVEGGTQAWVAAGLPVHTSNRSVLPLMRQVQIAVGLLLIVGAGLALAVNLWFAILPLFLGCGQVFAGVTGTCGMALMLARMPWNRKQENCAQCCAPGVGDEACA